MFNNRKNDPIVDSVKAVMEQSEMFRQIEQELLEEYGVVSRKALPHEIQPEFDAVLAEAKKCAMEELSPKQKKLAAVGKKINPMNNPEKIDAEDLHAARKGHASHIEEGDEEDDNKKKEKEDPLPFHLPGDKIRKIPSKAKGLRSYVITPKIMKEDSEQLDEVSKKTAISAYVQSASAAKDPTRRLDDSPRDRGKQSENILRMIKKKHGEKVAKDADRAAEIDDKGRYPRSKGLGYDPLEAKQSVVSAMKLKPSKKTGKLSGKDSDKLKNYFRHFQKEDSDQLDEKAVSEVQQKLMAMALRYKRDPESMQNASSEVKRLAQGMSEKQLRDFAKTSHKGLPERVDEDIDSIMEEICNNLEEQLIAVYESGDEDAFTDFVESLTEEQAEILGLDEQYSTPRGGPVSAPKTASDALKAADRGTRPPSTSHMGAGAPVRNVPGTSGSGMPGTGFTRNVSGPKVNVTPGGTVSSGGTVSGATRPATAPKTTPAVSTPAKVMPKAKPMAPARPAPGARPPSAQRPHPAGGAAAAQKRGFGFGAGGGADPGSAMGAFARSYGSANEETEKPQIKESFEQFIRNKFLKD